MPEVDSVGGLFMQLVDDGRDLVGAEVNLYKEIAIHRAARARGGLMLLGAAAVLGLAGLIAAFTGILLWLAPLIGAVPAGLLLLAVAALIAGLMVRSGLARLEASLEDEEDQSVIGDRSAA